MSNTITIAISGIDGAGKTTQCHLLKKYFEGIGAKVLISHLKFWGTRAIFDYSMKIHGSLGYTREEFREEYVEFILACDEYVTYSKLTRTIDNYDIVIYDRHKFDRLVNGIYANCDMTSLMKILGMIPEPQLTILLDLDPEVAIKRIRKRGGLPNATENYDELKLTRQIYLDSARHHSIFVIDAGKPPIELHTDILSLLKQLGLGQMPTLNEM